MVRLNWTLSAFYSSGGSTTFANRLAASLGIDPSTIKVVAVYTGSVVIDFNIIGSSDGQTLATT